MLYYIHADHVHFTEDDQEMYKSDSEKLERAHGNYLERENL